MLVTPGTCYYAAFGSHIKNCLMMRLYYMEVIYLAYVAELMLDILSLTILHLYSCDACYNETLVYLLKEPCTE